jgi:hypothetical protein
MVATDLTGPRHCFKELHLYVLLLLDVIETE